MSKHIIILGHGEGDPGASGVYKSERASLEEVGRAIKTHITKHKLSGEVELIDNINVYKRNDFARNTSKYRNAKSVTELHFNAFNGKARGTEILFGSGLNPDAMDKRFKKMLTKRFSWRRWLKSDAYQNPREAKRLGINYRLIEYCFCDNKKDIDIFNKSLSLIAKETLEVILNRKLNIGTSNPPKKPSGGLYRIQVGAFSKKSNADAFLKLVKRNYPDAFIKRSGNLYRIQVGAFSIKSNADKYLKNVKKKYSDAFITR